MSHLGVFALPALIVLGACAAIPADRGASAVTVLLDEHGDTPNVRLGDSAAAIAAAVESFIAHDLSEDDAVGIALINNPQLQIAYARLGVAAADVYDASRLSNPQLSFGVQDSSASGAATKITAGLMQNFAEILLLKQRERLAVNAAQQTKLAVAADLFGFAQDVRSAYFDAQAAIQVAELRAFGAAATTVSAALAARDFAAGRINRVELALAGAAVTEADLAAAMARSDASARRIDLGRLLGFDSERAWRLVGGLPLPVAAEDDLSLLRQLASTHSLELKAAASDAANALSTQALSARYPYLAASSIGIDYERDIDHSRLLGPSVSVKLPLFNHGKGQGLRAQAVVEQRQAALASLEIAVDNAIALAQSEVFAARERAGIYSSRFIPSRQDIVTRTLELQNIVALSPLALLRAKNAEYDAYAGYIEALRDYWRARVALTRAVGTALPSAATAGADRLNVAALVAAPPNRRGGGDAARSVEAHPTGDR